ncbi:Protein of unknown function, partial [Gryllus bimaculatus]
IRPLFKFHTVANQSSERRHIHLYNTNSLKRRIGELLFHFEIFSQTSRLVTVGFLPRRPMVVYSRAVRKDVSAISQSVN